MVVKVLKEVKFEVVVVVDFSPDRVDAVVVELVVKIFQLLLEVGVDITCLSSAVFVVLDIVGGLSPQPEKYLL